jgi:DNA-binding NtrC family response regulator
VKVAEELGMGFKTLYRKIEEYQLIVSGEMWYAGQEGM